MKYAQILRGYCSIVGMNVAFVASLPGVQILTLIISYRYLANIKRFTCTMVTLTALGRVIERRK
jgi:hypothetical protein